MNNNNFIPNNNIRFAVPKMLSAVQVLSQNNELDTDTKNRIVALIRKAASEANPNFHELRSLLARLRFSCTMHEPLDELLELTTVYK